MFVAQCFCVPLSGIPGMGMLFLLEKGEKMTNEEKYRQVRHEAVCTGLVLAAIIVFWCLAGFGAASQDIRVFHLPLWVVTSCIGTWVFALVLVRILTKKVFKDMNLEEDDRG